MKIKCAAQAAVLLVSIVACNGREARAMKLTPVGRIWKALAEARVLVNVRDLGVERVAAPGQGRVAWRETLEALATSTAARGEFLGRVHEVLIQHGRQSGARALTRNGATVLALDFSGGPLEKGDERAGPTPLVVPSPEAIQSVLAALPARPVNEVYEFDNRFALALAGAGLGLLVVAPDARDAAGRPAFHRVLAGYGPHANELAPAIAAMADRIDPLANPQVLLERGDTHGAALEMPMEATFPSTARPLRPVITFSVRGAGVEFPSPAELTAGWSATR
jgi:hypothetical protein